MGVGRREREKEDGTDRMRFAYLLDESIIFTRINVCFVGDNY